MPRFKMPKKPSAVFTWATPRTYSLVECRTVWCPPLKVSPSVRVEIVGEALRKSHLAKVRQYLQLSESDLKDDGGEKA